MGGYYNSSIIGGQGVHLTGGILGLLLEYPDFLKDVIVHIAIGYEYSQLRLIEILLIGISGNGLAVKP